MQRRRHSRAARTLPERVDGLVVVDTYGDSAAWYTEVNEELLKPFREDFVEERPLQDLGYPGAFNSALMNVIQSLAN